MRLPTDEDMGEAMHIHVPVHVHVVHEYAYSIMHVHVNAYIVFILVNIQRQVASLSRNGLFLQCFHIKYQLHSFTVMLTPELPLSLSKEIILLL